MKLAHLRRLANLEALGPEPAPTTAQDEPAPHLSDEERWRLLVGELRGHPGGPSPSVAFDPVTQRWQARHYQAGDLADLLNRIRERDPAPFIPLLPGEPSEALAMIDAGRWRMQVDGAAGFLHLLAWPDDHEASTLGARIRDGVLVWLAQTGEPYPHDLADLRAMLAPFANFDQDHDDHHPNTDP